MIRVVKLSFEQKYIDDFKHFFETRKELIKNFEGCTHLELWQDHDNPCIFFTYRIKIIIIRVEKLNNYHIVIIG